MIAMAEVKKTSTGTSKKVGSKRTADSCKARPKSTTKSGTGPGSKTSGRKK